MKNTYSYVNTAVGASIFLMLTSTLMRAIGFFREIIYANEFGITKEFDIYLIASVIPITLNTIIYYIGQNFFIPNYSEAVSKKNESIEFVKISLIVFGFLGFSTGIIVFIFARNLLSIFIMSGDNISGTSLTVFRIFALSIPISSFISIFAAYLNHSKKFLSPALSNLLLNISVIISVILFNTEIGVSSIAIGYLAGSIVQLVVLFYTSNLKLKDIFNSKFSLSKYPRIISSSLIIIIIIESFSQLYLISDRFFFELVKEGGISAINYAQNLVGLPISIISISISTVLFPRFAEDINNSSIRGSSSFADSVSVTLFIFVPIFIIFNFWGVNIISIILERGKFSAVDTFTTSQALRYLNYGIMFYAIYAILNKVLYSAKMINYLLLITISGILIKIIFNYVLIDFLDFKGLALSTTISYLFFFSASIFALKKIIGYRWLLKMNFEFIFLFFNGFISFLSADYIVSNLYYNHGLSFLFKLSIFMGVYLFNLYLIQSKNIIFILDRLKIRK